MIEMILSSVVVSAITAGVTSYFIEKRKYNQEYWRIAIGKRLEAYDEIEKVLGYFQITSLIKNNPCHGVFMNPNEFDNLMSELSLITWRRNWISSNLFQEIIKLNRLLSKLSQANIPYYEDYVYEEFGVENYNEISDSRDRMIKVIAKDYLEMPNVEEFFKSKLNENKY